MFQRNVKSWIRILFSSIIIIAFTSQPRNFVSALNSNSPLNVQLNYAIVFVSRQIPSNGTVFMSPNATGSMPGAGPYTRFEIAAPGKLLVREANGTLRTLIDGSNPTAASLNLIDVNAPDVSYEGTKIVFTGLPAGSYVAGPVTNPGAWRIYTINVDGSGLQQVTFSDQDNLDLSQFRTVAPSFRKYDDTDPAWLPDGRIVFSSTRWPSFAQYSGVRTSNLYVVNANGTSLHRITSERNGADRPLVDPITGKIVYSRWWRNFRFAVNGMDTVYINASDPSRGYKRFNGLSSDRNNQLVRPDYLWRNSWNPSTINPDGTGLALWAGGGLHTEMDNFAYGGAFTDDGTLIANFFPINNMSEAAGFGGIRQYHRGFNGYQPIIGVTTRNDSTQRLVSSNPPSYGVYQSAYSSEPATLPDGRFIISWANNTAQDYGLYIINADGTGLTRLYDNPGTTELRAHVIRVRPLPLMIRDRITQVASLLPPLDRGPYNVDGTFTFQDLNVYFNAPVDTNILNAMPVGSANTIRFFIDHQRWQQSGSLEGLDWPILLNESPVNSDGSITASSPANVPLFEQIRTANPGYTVPLTGNNALPADQGGAAHVAGMNFGRPGDVVRCVGCHAGHSLIPVPANPADAQWTNLAPGAAVSVSSLDSSLSNANGLTDRRVKMQIANPLSKYWISRSGLMPTSQWVQLTFPVPVTVRTVRLYNIPSSDSSIRVLNATVRLYADSGARFQVANRQSGALSENGTDAAFNDVYARTVRIEFNSVSGAAAGLGEVEVIARGETDVPLNIISGSTGVANTRINYSTGETVTDATGAYNIPAPYGSSGTAMPSNPCYTFNPTSRSYINVTASQVGQDFTPTLNPASGCADVNVSIGGANQGRYGLPSGNAIFDRYSNVFNGPVKVVSNTGQPIFASERTLYGDSFHETTGIPSNQLTTDYWLPWYDFKIMQTWISIGNPSTSQNANVSVYIAGQFKGSMSIAPLGRWTPSYPSVFDGPVEIKSTVTLENTGGQSNTSDIPIVVSERTLYGQNFNETNGIPANRLASEYWFPWYDFQIMQTWLSIGNPSATENANVSVYIAGQFKESYSISPNGRWTPSYPGIFNGPVDVKSTNVLETAGGQSNTAGIPIIATERTLYGQSFNETPGIRLEDLTTDYWLPAYDSKTMQTWVSIGNPSINQTANVSIYIGGQFMQSHSMPAQGRWTPIYDGTLGGPLEVKSTNGVSILVSARTLLGNSFSETNGIPVNQLVSEYWFPWYDFQLMQTSLFIGRP